MLMSGKLNELIDLFIGQAKAAAGGRNEGWVQAEPPTRAPRFFRVQCLLDACEDEPPRRTPLAGGSLAQAAMKVLRQINGCADKTGFHNFDCRRAT